MSKVQWMNAPKSKGAVESKFQISARLEIQVDGKLWRLVAKHPTGPNRVTLWETKFSSEFAEAPLEERQREAEHGASDYLCKALAFLQ